MRGITENLKSISCIPASYDYISMYAENRLFSKVSRASYDNRKNELSISMSGRSSMKQKMYLLLEDGNKITERQAGRDHERQRKILLKAQPNLAERKKTKG